MLLIYPKSWDVWQSLWASIKLLQYPTVHHRNLILVHPQMLCVLPWFLHLENWIVQLHWTGGYHGCSVDWNVVAVWQVSEWPRFECGLHFSMYSSDTPPAQPLSPHVSTQHQHNQPLSFFDCWQGTGHRFPLFQTLVHLFLRLHYFWHHRSSLGCWRLEFCVVVVFVKFSLPMCTF